MEIHMSLHSKPPWLLDINIIFTQKKATGILELGPVDRTTSNPRDTLPRELVVPHEPFAMVLRSLLLLIYSLSHIAAQQSHFRICMSPANLRPFFSFFDLFVYC